MARYRWRVTPHSIWLTRLEASPRIRGALVSGGIVLALVLAYGGVATSGPGTCPSRWLLSAPCATCGMTRAFAAIVRGDLFWALRANAGSLVAFALVAALTLAYGAQAVTGETYVARVWAHRTGRRAVGAVVLAVILFSWATNLDRHRHGRGPLSLPSWHRAHGVAPWFSLPGGE